jgi:alcohol dehydrogenase (NADP+)
VYKSGKAKAIGISNFSKAEIEKLLANSDVVPAAHQLELHPYLAQTEFTKWNQSKGIHITAYSPFGNSNPTYTKGQEIPQLIQDPELAKIGEKYGKTGAQTALAWAVAQGWSVLPKSKTESRIKANFEGDFKLSAEDVAAVTKLDKKLRFNDPSESFNWAFYADLDGK